MRDSSKEIQRLQKKMGECRQDIAELKQRIAKLEEGNRYRKRKDELREELTEELSNHLLGEKIPWDMVNTKTRSVIVHANQKITKPLLRKLASVYNCIEIDPSPIRVKIREIISVYEKRFEELETKHRQNMDSDSGPGEEASNRDVALYFETYIAKLLKGTLMPPGNCYDVHLERSNGVILRIEVKFSNLGHPVQDARTLYWTWSNLLGHEKKKFYDRLILVGEPDPRYATNYNKGKDPSARYVLFDIPFDQVSSISYRGGDRRLTSNPNRVQTGIGRELYEKWQVSESELAKRSERWKKGGAWEI